VSLVRSSVGARALLVAAALVAVVVGIRWAAPVIGLLLLSALIAAAVLPLVGLLERVGLVTSAAVALSMALSVAAVAGFGVLVVVAVSDLVESAPALERLVAQVQSELSRLIGPSRSHDAIADPERVVGVVVAGIGRAIPDALSSFGVVLFTAVFMVLEGATFRDKLWRALRWKPARRAHLGDALQHVQRYLAVKTWISLGMGLVTALFCAALGVDNVVLWGVVTFAFNYVPVFGPTLATIGPALAALLELGPWSACAVLAGLIAVHNILGNVVEPKWMGRALGLSPLVVMVSIVAWGWMLGPIGALLSVPLTLMVKLVLAQNSELSPYAVLLEPGSATRRELGAP
jgi:predicted PurR-regulated permease PerM